MFRKCLVIALLFVTGAGFAQQSGSTISGIVKEENGSKPLHFVTVELFKNGNLTTPLQSVYTNDNGSFRLNGVDTGAYVLNISHTGFMDKKVDVVVNSNTTKVDDITLTAAPKEMQGVVVKARRPLIEQQDDKIIFNVENDPATKTETALDILRKTPFVTVDGEDNITVNGQTNFKVHLNGRETAMFAQNVKEALKGFSGSMILKIEVITTPSAKYDGEGVGGIINIITKKKVAGYNGNVNLWYSTIGWKNANANFSAKSGKVGISFNYGINGGNNIPGSTRMETISKVPSYFSRRLLTGDRTMTNFWNWGNAEVSWEMDSLNTLSFYGNLSGGQNKNELDQTITTYFPSGLDSVGYYHLKSKYEYPTKSVGADFIKKFNGNKEKEFSVRVNGEFGKSNAYLNSFMDNTDSEDRYVINNSVADNKQYTIQSDYIHPLKNNKKIEVGVKGIFRRATSDFQSMISTHPGDYKQNDDNTDYFRYDQDVYSAYSTFNFKIKKVGFRLGARLEHTAIDGDFVSSNTKVNQQYTNVLPNIQVTSKLSKALTLVFSYSDRLQRPFIWNLNPFKNNNDPKNISFGNPNLDPQVIHSLSVQSRIMKGGTFAGITFIGTYSDNMIVPYSTFDAATGVTSTTSGNLGKETSISAQGNISTKFNPKWTVSVNGNIRYSQVKNKLLASQTNSGFGGNANMNTTYTISKRFNASGYAGFYRNGVSIQTSYPLNIWYGLNAGYKFFDEKLTLSVGLANFFQKDRDYKLITKDPAFQTTNVTTSPSRGISTSISWSFGKLTENVSKKKGVTNDDLIGGGNGN